MNEPIWSGHVHCDEVHKVGDGSSCIRIVVRCPCCRELVVVRLLPVGAAVALTFEDDRKIYGPPK